MTMSLTPGPWKAARVFENNAPDSFKVFTKPFGGVCVADCGDNEENATLIAAAPTMLNALKDCLAKLEDPYVEEIVTRAINKAEGRE
jgi:hypothetical protein